MAPQRALLVQDLIEYRALLKNALRTALEAYTFLGLTEDDILEWIIREEVEEIYGIQVKGHEYKRWPQTVMRSIVDRECGHLLTAYTSYFVKVPKLYKEMNEIEVELRGRDVFIRYERDSLLQRIQHAGNSHGRSHFRW